jgi:TetR/AcrR family transcriptional regulator, regulator of cefoperazone and chloramphenicol sensitivity
MKIPRQDADRTRKSLLAAASELFAERGYHDATITEISERAKANIAAVNYHFGNKETLYKEAWRQSFHDSIKAHPPDGGVDGDASPEQRLAGRVTALLRRITDEDNRAFLIVYKELANPTGLLEEVMQEEMRPLRQSIETMVREVLGPGNSALQVRFCAISIISQCVIPAVINMAEKPASNGDNDSWRVDDIDAYADHVFAFSVAGMGAIKRNAKKGTDTKKTVSHAHGSAMVHGHATHKA